MPRIKRYFHVSQEINADPEVWSFTAEFGERAIGTWLQSLIYLDKTGNEWRLTGDWLGTLSRMVRQAAPNISRQIDWMVARGWLRPREPAVDGSPLVFEAPNWAKYHQSRDAQRVPPSSRTGTEDGPLLTYPTPSLSYPIHKKEIAVSALPSPARPPRRTVQLADDEFIAQLRPNPAYRHIDIDAELGKMDAWFLTPNGARRKRTRTFVVRWLNKAADTQREVTQVSPLPNSISGCAEKVLASNGRA